jgi:lipopolysaccharide transport system permease protein
MEMVHRSATDRGPLLCSPLQVFSSAWIHRKLILRLARREIEARYRGSMLGIAWSLLVPLILLAVYTVVFSGILKARWDLPVSGKGAFALVLFSGLILFTLVAECCNRAPSLMIDNVTYIKKVVFPLEALSWVTVAVAMFNCGVSLLAFLVGYLLLIGLPPVSALMLPVMILPLALLAVGASWFLSSLGVYLRDIQQFVPVLVTIMLYLNPILYPRELLPGSLSTLMQFSPLAVMIEGARAAFFGGPLPSWTLILFHLLSTWALAWLGLMWFMKTRKGFADVT